MIKINPANSLISFSFPAMQMFSHNSVSDAVSRLLRWLKKKKTQTNLGINSENPKKLSHYHCAIAHAVIQNRK